MASNWSSFFFDRRVWPYINNDVLQFSSKMSGNHFFQRIEEKKSWWCAKEEKILLKWNCFCFFTKTTFPQTKSLICLDDAFQMPKWFKDVLTVTISKAGFPKAFSLSFNVNPKKKNCQDMQSDQRWTGHFKFWRKRKRKKSLLLYRLVLGQVFEKVLSTFFCKFRTTMSSLLVWPVTKMAGCLLDCGGKNRNWGQNTRAS